MRRRYWDSCAFLGWLRDEQDKVSHCRPAIAEARAGRLAIVTSALTIAEVLWLTGKDPIPKSDRESVRRFFEHEWIVVYEVDRKIAEAAQDVVWDFKVKPKDAIHVATALDAEVEQLDTFDGPLQSQTGTVGDPPLRIGPPDQGLPQSLLDEVEGGT